MIVFATKLTAKKAAVGVFMLCAVALSIAWIGAEESVPAAAAVSLDAKITSAEDAADLLENCGWSIDRVPLSVQEVQIPETFDAAYESYNALQEEQGLGLSPHRGKRATLYTFTVKEHPSGEEGVTANLVVRKKKLIAGDICSARSDGFLHGLLEHPAPNE